MKVIKRKTPIKCPKCKTLVIGYKYPPTLDGFSCDVEYNENASKNNVKFYRRNKLNIRRVCLNCE